MTPSELNQQFGKPGLTFIEGPGGLTFADIENAGGVARIALQGAHIVSWRPANQQEAVVWVSDDAKYGPGKSIRGGVPVCWPWFGPHASEKAFPGHGFARTVMWQVSATEVLATGEHRIRFSLVPEGDAKVQFPAPCKVELTATVGSQLRVDLQTHNLGHDPIVIGEALHTYLRIGDIGTATVTGLEGVAFVDKVDGGARKQQAGAIAFSGEVDRVYVDTEGDCILIDPDLGRRIRISTASSRSTVVWTPWQDKAEKMGDMGPGRKQQGGWREMVCVESGNALENQISVAAGSQHTLSVTYSAEAL